MSLDSRENFGWGSLSDRHLSVKSVHLSFLKYAESIQNEPTINSVTTHQHSHSGNSQQETVITITLVYSVCERERIYINS